MASLADQTVHTGNTVTLMIGGKPIGRAQSLTAQRSFGTEGVYEIGSIMPQEHVYLKFEGSVTLQRMRIRTQDLADLGLAPLGNDVLKMNIIDIVVTDKTTGQPLETYNGASINSYNTEYRANEIVSEQIEFLYLYTSKGSQSGAEQSR